MLLASLVMVASVFEQSQCLSWAPASSLCVVPVGIGATLGYQWNWHPFALRFGAGVDWFRWLKAQL